MDWWVVVGKTIEDAGGWAAFLGLLSLIGLGLWRKWWVPGFLYVELEAEVKDLKKVVSRLTARLARERRQRGTDGRA
jgi:hypothetical protein